METILEEKSDNITLSKKFIERLVGTKFINDVHWEIFQDNFKIRFLSDNTLTLPNYFEWSIDDYDDVISRV